MHSRRDKGLLTGGLNAEQQGHEHVHPQRRHGDGEQRRVAAEHPDKQAWEQHDERPQNRGKGQG